MRARADKDLASIGLVTLIWGTTWFAITLQLGTVPAVQSVVYRFALAALIIFGWRLAQRRSVALSLRQHAAAAGQGLFTFAIDYPLVYFAEQRLASAVVAVVWGALALVNLILFRLVLGQRAPGMAWAGASLGAVGVGVLSASELVTMGLDPRVGIGLACAMGSVVFATVGNLFANAGNRLLADTVPMTAWAMAYGAAGLALWVAISGQTWSLDLRPTYVGSLAYLSVIGSALAFVVYFDLARRRGYTLAAYINAMTPVVAMVLSSVFEGAHWGLGAVVAVALVLAGQLLLIRTRSAEPAVSTVEET